MSLDLDGLIPATVLPMHAGREHRRAGPPVVHRVGRRAGPGCPRDQRRHRRRTPSHARREGPDHQGRPRRDRPADRGRARRPVDRRRRPPGPRLPCRRRRRPARLPDPGLPELAAQPRRPGRVPHRDRRGRPPADPVPAPARARRRELRERRPPGDGRSRWRRGHQGGVVRCPPVRRHRPAARAAAEEDHAPHRQRQLHPRVVPARRDGRADRVRRGHDPRAGRHDPGLAGGPHATTRWPSDGASSGSRTSCSRLRSATTASVSRSASGSSGVLEAAHVRRPLLPISDAERAHLTDVLKEVGLLREPVSAGRVD